MADMNLERRQSGGTGWLWGLLLLLVAAGVAWWALDEFGGTYDPLVGDYAAETDIAAYEEYGDETGAYDEEADAFDEETDGVDGAEEMEAAERGAPGVALGNVLGNPVRYVGEEVTATVRVDEAVSARGFWVASAEGGDGRILAVVGSPDAGTVEVETGQVLRVEGARVRDAAELSAMAGELDEGLRLALEGQSAYLAIDPAGIQVLEETGAGG